MARIVRFFLSFFFSKKIILLWNEGFFFFWLNASKISAPSGMKIWGETNNKALGGGDFYLKKPNKQTKTP